MGKSIIAQLAYWTLEYKANHTSVGELATDVEYASSHNYFIFISLYIVDIRF